MERVAFLIVLEKDREGGHIREAKRKKELRRIKGENERDFEGGKKETKKEDRKEANNGLGNKGISDNVWNALLFLLFSCLTLLLIWTPCTSVGMQPIWSTEQ